MRRISSRRPSGIPPRNRADSTPASRFSSGACACAAERQLAAALARVEHKAGPDALVDVVNAARSLPPRYSIAAQITPPVLAIRCGTTSTPRWCSASSASSVQGMLAPCATRRVASSRRTSYTLMSIIGASGLTMQLIPDPKPRVQRRVNSYVREPRVSKAAVKKATPIVVARAASKAVNARWCEDGATQGCFRRASCCQMRIATRMQEAASKKGRLQRKWPRY